VDTWRLGQGSNGALPAMRIRLSRESSAAFEPRRARRVSRAADP
jgi:hypothetical protein